MPRSPRITLFEFAANYDLPAVAASWLHVLKRSFLIHYGSHVFSLLSVIGSFSSLDLASREAPARRPHGEHQVVKAWRAASVAFLTINLGVTKVP